LLLADHQIRELCLTRGMVVPYNEELLNPASLDVTLGTTLLVEVEHTPELQPLDISLHTQEQPYYLAPGEFVLAQTREMFNIPDDICAQFILKSSRAREGIEHLLAGFADAGFNNSVLTLELQNARRLHSVAIWPGMKIGQLVFMAMLAAPDVSYAVKGNYNGDKTVMASRGHL
jgi:dCTP deaminase